MVVVWGFAILVHVLKWVVQPRIYSRVKLIMTAILKLNCVSVRQLVLW